MRSENAEGKKERAGSGQGRNFLKGSRILVAHASAGEPDSLLHALETSGADLLLAADVQEALTLYRPHTIDLVVVVISLAEFGGWAVLRTLRVRAETPLIVIGPHDERVEVACLAAGADDYVGAQTAPAVLLARVRALLRRAGFQAHEAKSGAVYDDGYLQIDLRQRRVSVGGRDAGLAPKEYELLRYLLLHRGEPQTYEQILLDVWDRRYLDRTEDLHTYIGDLRRKIEPDPSDPIYLRTVYRLGYEFGTPPTDA